MSETNSYLPMIISLGFLSIILVLSAETLGIIGKKVSSLKIIELVIQIFINEPILLLPIIILGVIPPMICYGYSPLDLIYYTKERQSYSNVQESQS